MADTSKAGFVATEVLARAGVKRLYTVPGESFLEILDAAERHPDLALISTRHESGASFMAEADAKLTGMPAVAMATRGVGASNLAIGVHTAMQDSSPMLVLLGQVETDFLGREAFQEVDLPAFYAPITKWSATVNRADRLAEFVARGLRIATSGRPGPVMLALPADVLGEEVAANPEASVQTSPVAGPDPEQVRAVVRRLGAARRPVVIAGGGAQGRSGGSGISFAETFGAGVYASFRRQDVFPNDHPNYLGHLTLGTPPETLKALEEADLVLVVGCRLSEVTTQSYSLPRGDQTVIQVDVDPDEVGATVPVEIGMVSDARSALAAFDAQAPPEPSWRDWTEAHGAYLDSSTIPPARTSEGIDPSQVVRGHAGDPASGLAAGQRRRELLGLRPPLLALQPPGHAARLDERRDGLRRSRGGGGEARGARQDGRRVLRRRRFPDDRPGDGDGGQVRRPHNRHSVPQRAAGHHSHAPEAGPRTDVRRRDRRGRPRRLRQEPRRRRPHGTRSRRARASAAKPRQAPMPSASWTW